MYKRQVLVVDATQGKTPADHELVELFQQKNIPYLIAYNKSDLAAAPALGDREIAISAQTKEGIEELKERIARLVKTGEEMCIRDSLCCDLGHELGFRTFVLQGGEDLSLIHIYLCQVLRGHDLLPG